MPTRTDDLERRSATELARARPDNGEAPGRGIFARLGDHSADGANFSFVAGECLDTIHVPKFHVLFALGILVALAAPLVLRKKSVRDEFVGENLRETLDCSHWHTRGMLP